MRGTNIVRHTVTPTHTLRDLDLQRERLTHTEIQTH